MHSRFLSFLCAFITTTSYAVSFDCTKASTSVEKMICTDPMLAGRRLPIISSGRL